MGLIIDLRSFARTNVQLVSSKLNRFAQQILKGKPEKSKEKIVSFLTDAERSLSSEVHEKRRLPLSCKNWTSMQKALLIFKLSYCTRSVS